MKLDYNLINIITNSNKKEEAATILDDHFTDLEGHPVATPTKVRSFVAYPYVEELPTGGDTDTIERVFSEYNKSYNVNDYPFGFVFCGDEYIGKITIDIMENTDSETGGGYLVTNDIILLTPEHTEYQQPEFDDYESEEYINYFKQHIKEELICDQMFPRILKAIETDKHCWFIPYYANNNIESEDLTSLGYSKNSPFLPLVFNRSDDYEYLIIQPELPNYIHI